LPMASAVSEEALRALRPEVIAFVTGAIGALGVGAPAVVLALPCELDAALTAAGSSYPYPKGDPTLARDILAAAGLGDLPAWVLNDAELAAEAAALDPRVPRRCHTLVLTFGFGVGAALLRARE
jgi:predicted NBD/HSP70 family sugar kinase